MKQEVTAKTLKEIEEFVEKLKGVPSFPGPVIEVETIDGVLYEVGGTWRQYAAGDKVSELPPHLQFWMKAAGLGDGDQG